MAISYYHQRLCWVVIRQWRKYHRKSTHESKALVALAIIFHETKLMEKVFNAMVLLARPSVVHPPLREEPAITTTTSPVHTIEVRQAWRRWLGWKKRRERMREMEVLVVIRRLSRGLQLLRWNAGKGRRKGEEMAVRYHRILGLALAMQNWQTWWRMRRRMQVETLWWVMTRWRKWVVVKRKQQVVVRKAEEAWRCRMMRWGVDGLVRERNQGADDCYRAMECYYRRLCLRGLNYFKRCRVIARRRHRVVGEKVEALRVIRLREAVRMWKEFQQEGDR